jgi:hypothetical protein
MTSKNLIKVIYSKKSGSKKFRVAAYFNENFNCEEYRVEQYKKAGTKYCWWPVGNLKSDYADSAIEMLERRF